MVDKVINAKNKSVLVIPDLHMPFHHPDSFLFLEMVKEKFLDKDSIIINLGDEVDGHCISFHDTDPDIMFTPSTELEKAIEYAADLQKIFPKMHVLESNHGSLVYRRQKAHGLPRRVFKSYKEILETPKWNWYDDILLKTHLGEVYLCHGKTSANGKLAKEMGCSSIQGHFHGKFQILWHKTATRETFDAYGGCLINAKELAFSYGKNHMPKPILGCLFISSKGYPSLIKMHLKDNRWIQDILFLED